MPEPDLSVRKNSIALAISRDMAIDYGLVEATPEEVEQRNADGERFHREQKMLRARWLPIVEKMKAAPALAGVMFRLHAPHDNDHGVTCTGCTEDNEHGPQDWPCKTVEVVAEWCRMPLPGSSMPGKHYEGDWTPWDGKPFRLPRPESFVTLDPNDIG